MLKIGCNIPASRIDGSLKVLKSSLEELTRLGLFAVELPIHGLDVIKNGRLDHTITVRVREILNEFDFHYSVHSPNPLNLMDNDNRALHRDVFIASLEFASEIQSKIMVYHPGRFLHEDTFHLHKRTNLSEQKKEQMMALERKELAGIASCFPDITICMENARPYLFHSPYCYAEEIKPLIQQVSLINRENVKINIDFGHLYLASKLYGFDPVAAMIDLAPFIEHTHIHDNFGKCSDITEKDQSKLIPFGKGDCHAPVGWGEIPFSALLAPLITHYDGMFMMEFRERYFEYIEESRNSLNNIVMNIP